MIVDESSVMRVALDRRLQIDRLPGIDPLRAIADPAGPPRRDAGPARGTSELAAVTEEPSLLRDRLPIGRSASAQVLEAPHPERVLIDLEGLRFEFAWPKANGAAPLPGQSLRFLVLAHDPLLTLQGLDLPEGGAVEHRPAAPPAPWSADALRLQMLAGPLAASVPGTGALRFDVPLVAPSSALSGKAIADLISNADHDPRSPAEVVRTPPDFAPLLFHGPAWSGQPMELMIRRERADETLDNPALDHWCGELLIDLPRLGRVAGHLAFSMRGLRVRLEADDEAGASRMTEASAELAAAFTRLDLRVSGLSVGRPAGDAMRATDSVSPPAPIEESRRGPA